MAEDAGDATAADDDATPDPRRSSGSAAQSAAIQKQLEFWRQSVKELAVPARELTKLPPEDRLHRQDLAQDIQLKRQYAKWLLGAMLGQMLFANVVFVLYAWLGRDWVLSPSVINVWLGATLAEVVGIVLVVTRYLFPRRDHPLGKT